MPCQKLNFKVFIEVESLGVILYFEPVRMSENVLDPPLDSGEWINQTLRTIMH